MLESGREILEELKTTKKTAIQLENDMKTGQFDCNLVDQETKLYIRHLE